MTCKICQGLGLNKWWCPNHLENHLVNHKQKGIEFVIDNNMIDSTDEGLLE